MSMSRPRPKPNDDLVVPLLFYVNNPLRIGKKLVLRFNLSIMRHAQFISRTVLVQNGNVDEALRVLNKLMAREGFLDQYRRTRYYEKPFEVRRRLNYEKCKALYNEDMSRKIQLVMRKNRLDPFPGTF